MTDLTVVCWLWQNRNPHLTKLCAYSADDVNRFARMVKRNLRIPHRVVCITDVPEGITECDTMPLWRDYGHLTSHVYDPTYVSCYKRLKIFDKEVAESFGTDRILSMDLDTVIAADFTDLITMYDSPFVGYRAKLNSRPNTYNGSMFMFEPGNPVTTQIWDKFDIERSPNLCNTFMYRGTDQAWISYLLADQYPFWSNLTGIYAWRKDRLHERVPNDLKIAMFFGRHKPHMLDPNDHPWVFEHWR